MTAESKPLTDWFDGSIKPARYGWYDAQVRIYLTSTDYFTATRRLMYKNRVWWMVHPKIESMGLRTQPPLRWRGLLKDSGNGK